MGGAEGGGASWQDNSGIQVSKHKSEASELWCLTSSDAFEENTPNETEGGGGDETASLMVENHHCTLDDRPP